MGSMITAEVSGSRIFKWHVLRNFDFQSLQINLAVYEVWLNAPQTLQKDLLIMMIRSQRAFTLNAFVFTASLDSFTVVRNFLVKLNSELFNFWVVADCEFRFFIFVTSTVLKSIKLIVRNFLIKLNSDFVLLQNMHSAIPYIIGPIRANYRDFFKFKIKEDVMTCHKKLNETRLLLQELWLCVY